MSVVETATKTALANSLKMLMRSKTLDKISTEEICQNAKVGRRSFYRHFPDKYALVDWIYYSDFLVNREHPEDWCIWDHVPSICESLYKDREFYRHAFQLEGQNSFRQFCYEQLYPLLHHDFHTAFDDKHIEEVCLRTLTNVVFDDFVRWLKSEPCMPPDEYARMVHGYFARFSVVLSEVCNRPLHCDENKSD